MRTRKQQIEWMRGIIAESENTTAEVYENFKAASQPRNSTIDNAEYFLRGLGLSAFPFWDDAQEKQLREWGYKPTPRMVANFWRVSASLLVDIFRADGFIN